MKKLLNLLWISFFPFLSGAQNDLLPDTVKLNEVTVSSDLPLKNNDVLDYYRSNHFATLDNINARLEGMSLIKRGAYALEPQLHGFSGGQLNVTIDGMKMFGACTDKMDPITSYIEPTNLKSIRISQGTNGCLTGCNIGGSVDLTLQEPDWDSPYKYSTSLGLGYESVSRGRNVLFSSGFGNKKWGFEFDGVYRKNENYRDGQHKIVPFSQFEKANIHSVIQYKPDNISSFKIDLVYDIARNVGYPALPMDVSKAQAGIVALEYRRAGSTQLKAKVYLNTVQHIMDDSRRDSTFFLENKLTGKNDTVYMHMDMPGRSTTLGTYLQAERFWNAKNKLLLKFDNYTNFSIAEMTMYMNRPETGPEPPMYMQTWPEMLRNVTGFFIQNTTYVSPEFLFTMNGRLDYAMDVLQSEYGQQQFSVFGYSLGNTRNMMVKSLNLNAEYTFSNQVRLGATLGYAERLPTIGERMGFYLYNAYDGYDYIGNPYLKSEKSDFARVDLQIIRPKIKVNLSQTVSFISDYIIGITNPDIPAMNFYTNGTRVYSNISSARLFGTDLQLLVHPTKWISFFMLTKFTLGELGSGEPIPLIPPLKNVFSVKYQQKKYSVQFENETALAQNRINRSYGESQTPAYSLFNLKGSYSISFSKTILDMGCGITNLLNRVYHDHLDWGRINRPGRNVDLFLKYSF
jgi:iron complex outermembrane receptor protein